MSKMMERIRMEFWRGAGFSASPQGTKVLMSHQAVEDGIRAAIEALRLRQTEIGLALDAEHLVPKGGIMLGGASPVAIWNAMIDVILTPAPTKYECREATLDIGGASGSSSNISGHTMTAGGGWLCK